MRLPIKYHYSYFILPFIINQNNYNEYLKNIINKGCFKKINFSKKNNANLYITFSKNLTSNLLSGNSNSKHNSKNLLESIKNNNLNVFEYNNPASLVGALDFEKDENTIYFDLQNIKLYIFKNGVCFLVLKTNITSQNFEDVLDFNYRFKEVISNLNNLNKFQTIKLSDSKHDSLTSFKDFIESLIDVDLNKISDYTNMENFYTFSYTCLENSVWNEKTDENILTNIIQKYMKVYSSSYNADVALVGADIKSEYEYRKIGLTKVSSNLLCSGIDPYNFGYLPVEYETTYLFAYILALFYKISLNFFDKRLFNLKDKDKASFKKIVQDLNNFNKNFWSVDITNSQRMTVYFNGLIKILNLNNLYLSIITKINLIYKENKIEENSTNIKRLTIFIFTVLIIYIIFKIGGWK